MDRERFADGSLAAAALVAVLLAAVALDVRARPSALAVGVVGALGLEVVLQRRHDAVRAAWARSAVKAGTVGAFVAALVLAVAVAPAPGLSVLAGGLVGYLALFAGVAVGRALVA